MTPSPASVIPPGLERFLTIGVGVVAASRNAALVPSVVKGLACRIDGDGRSLIVFFVRRQAEQFLQDIAAQGVISATCSQPSTHRSLQFKGDDAHEVPVRTQDVPLVRASVDAFVLDLVSCGFAESFARALTAHAGDGLAAVRFTVAAMYDQTPGPRAGDATRPGWLAEYA